MRLLIPEIIAGMPYIAEELGSQVIESEFTEIPEGQKIEPSEDESLEKEKEKMALIDKLARELQKILTVKDLDDRLNEKKAKIEQSTIKDDILSIYKNRRESLLVQELSEKTGFSIGEVQMALDKGFLPESLLEEILSDNLDAKAEFSTQMANFLNALKKKENGELGI